MASMSDIQNAVDILTFHAARQRMLDGKPQRCPRCGNPAIKPRLHTNALSRIKKPRIYICDVCGVKEAILSKDHSVLLPVNWAAISDPNWRCGL